MENLYEVVQKIQLKKYYVTMDKHDIQEVINFSLKYFDRYSEKNYSAYKQNDEQIFQAAIIQILQKIIAKKEKIKTAKKIKFTLTPVEYYALKDLIDIADFADMLFHDILLQLDKQKQ